MKTTRKPPALSLLLALFLFSEMALIAETAAPLKARKALSSGESAVRIVCFGDSVTGLYYHTGGRRAYPELLAEVLREEHPDTSITVINSGRSGHTTANGLGRIVSDVLTHRPHLVTVMFGLNDVAKLPIGAFRENLIDIVSKCRTTGAEVILCTPNAVLTTPERPVEKVIAYAEVIRSVAREFQVPLCDTFASLEALRLRDPESWRLAMSDEIHPNLNGHRRIAELLTRTIIGKEISLPDKAPVPDPLSFTLTKLQKGLSVKVLAMPPFDTSISESLEKAHPGASVMMIPWPVDSLTRQQLKKDAAHRVRTLVPDLVIIAVPRSATAADREEFIHTQMWIASNSLSRGKREWDALVVHPDVFEPNDESADQTEDDLIRAIVPGQDLPLVDRLPGDDREAGAILSEWILNKKMPGVESKDAGQPADSPVSSR